MEQEPELTEGYQYTRTRYDRFIAKTKARWYAAVEPRLLRVARFLHEHEYQDPSEKPLISVMMPTFKRGQLLIDRTLPSIFAQTYQNFEVVIVGDRRIDNTEKLIQNLNHPKVHFYHRAEYTHYPKDVKARWHVGGGPQRNKGLSVSRGKWIAELDDDDMFTPDHLETLLLHAQKNNLEFVSSSGVMRRRGVDLVIDSCWETPKIGGIPTWLYRSYLRFFRYNMDSWRKGYNRGQDYDRAMRMYKAGVRTGFNKKVLAYSCPDPKSGLTSVGLDALEERTGLKLR